MQIVMLHENDPARGGCAFAQFFKSTPTDLISEGLYDVLALAMHTDEYRQVRGHRCRFTHVYCM